MRLANVGRGRVRLGLGMRMINCEDLPAVDLFDLANDPQQFEWISHVTRLRRSVGVGHGEDLERASILAANHAPGFVGRIAPRLGDELFELVGCEYNH